LGRRTCKEQEVRRKTGEVWKRGLRGLLRKGGGEGLKGVKMG
jgi:hypothetical protein